jgi:hypothetical protein
VEQAYFKTCPHCGGQLQPNASGPEIPPWRCDDCLVFYWVAELSQEARASYRPAQMDWGHRGSAAHLAVREAVRIEAEQACLRGVSVRREQLGLLDKRSVSGLLRRGHVIRPDFEHELRQQT